MYYGTGWVHLKWSWWTITVLITAIKMSENCIFTCLPKQVLIVVIMQPSVALKTFWNSIGSH